MRGKVCSSDPNDPVRYTIGWFYDEIKRALVGLSRSGQITFGYAERQVDDWARPGRIYVITSLE